MPDVSEIPVLENDFVFKPVVLISTIAIAAVLHVISGYAIHRIFKRSNVPHGRIYAHIIRAIIWFLALLAVLEPVFDIRPTAFIAALGIGSIAFTLSMQNTVANVITGLELMFTHVIDVGYWIETGEYQGEITDISWRATTIRTLLGDAVVIPNSVLGSTTLRKMAPYSSRGLVLNIDVKPEFDMAEVEKELREIVELACDKWRDHSYDVLLIQQGYGTLGFRIEVRVALISISFGLDARSAIIAACSGRDWLARLDSPAPQVVAK